VGRKNGEIYNASSHSLSSVGDALVTPCSLLTLTTPRTTTVRETTTTL
jgi:hypothetical protein